MTTAFDSQGTLIQISASSTAEVYVTIGEVREFSVNRAAPEIDVSSVDSVFREFLPGLPDGGQYTCTANLQANTTSTTTGQYHVLNAFNTLNPNFYFRLVLDNSSGTDSAIKWNGPVTSYNITGGVDNQVSVQFGGRMNTTGGFWAATTG